MMPWTTNNPLQAVLLGAVIGVAAVAVIIVALENFS